jgi:putative phosphoesterase
MKLGIISDTHIPDRARRLHPQVLPLFREAGVSAILHAGDVSSPGVLKQLGEVAPVVAVRGNRDWVLMRRLPLIQQLTFGSISIVLTHGHGRWQEYLLDKADYLLNGYPPGTLPKPPVGRFSCSQGNCLRTHAPPAQPVGW